MHIRVGQVGSTCTFSVRKLRKKPSGLRNLRPENNAKLDFKESGFQDMDWVNIAQQLSERGN